MPNSITFSSTLLSNSHSTACSSQFTQPKDRRITVLICLLLGSCLLLSTPYNVSQTYSTSSSNKIISSSTTNTAYKHKAQPWAHAWLPPMPTFSWLLSKNECCFIHLTTFYHSSGYASSTTFSCFGLTGPPPSQPSFNTSTHSIPQSNSPTSNLTIPSTSWTLQSYSLNNVHYNPLSTSNPPTKVYYSTTPLTTRQPVKKASFTAKPFDNDVSSLMMTNYGYTYYDYTKSSWPEATVTPPSPPQSTKPLEKHKANYSNISHQQPLPVSTSHS